MTEPIMNVFEVLDKLDFFNQRAGRELWSEKPVDVQNKDIENFSNDVAFLKDYITSQNAELLQYAKDQHDLMIEKDELFDIAEKQNKEIEFLIRMKASDFETSYTAVKARLADEMNRAEIDRRKDTEIRQLRIKLDDCERDIIPKLKYSLERANKYGAETDAENIRLLKENETLCSDLTFSKAEIERLKDNYDKAMDNLKSVLEERADHSEAIKDFAERLTHTLVINNEENTEFFDFSYTLETIDNLVKEMIGEQE